MNPELMKVIAGLECCVGEDSDCDYCSYKGKGGVALVCMLSLMRDALKILREVAEDGLY